MGVLSAKNINDILTNSLSDPFDVLGMHLEEGGVSVRAFLPRARTVDIVPREGDEILGAMSRVHDDGVFEIFLAGRAACFKYHLLVERHDGTRTRSADPYSFLPVMSDQARYLFGEGNHHRIFDDLGSHLRHVDGVSGTVFAVWAPNALRVSLVGDFNGWDGRAHPMRCIGSSGIWEIFLPGIGAGTVYKYEIKKRAFNHLILKTDPYGYSQEPPPNHASIVCDIDTFEWSDRRWMERRAATEDFLNVPMSIYEVHLGSWKKAGPNAEGDYLGFKELAHELADYVKEMGFTHVELLPVQDHPYVPSWGYQVCGFYAPNHRFGPPADFQYFVNHLHNQGIAVIIDWVSGHFPRDAYGLAYFDGTHLYEHQDPREGEHKDWGTLIFNYGRHEVRNFLVGNALFWLEKFHVDGLRVDAVASMLYRDYSRKEGEWIPNKHGGRENLEAVEFLQSVNRLVHEKFPGAVMIAEESTAWPMVSRPTHAGGLGFSFKWNMGWMNDMLVYFSKDSVFRKYHHNQLTFGLWYAFTENFILVVSHDEVVHGKRSLLEKMPGDRWQRYANLRAFLGFMFGHPGKKLLFQGCEFGMHWEWDAMQSISWHVMESDDDRSLHRGVAGLVKDLNRLYVGEPALWERDFDQTGFSWIDHTDFQNSVVSFIRFGAHRDSFLVFVCNFTPVVRPNYRIGVPEPGFYREVLNTDSEFYGGSNCGNGGGKQAEAFTCHGRPFSVTLTLPSLATLVLKWQKTGNS